MGRGDDASPDDEALAEKLGELIAREGWLLLTGGRDAGVMRAANRGAKQVTGSITIGVLPSAAGSVAPGVDIAIFTGMGDARDAINVLSSDVVVICGSPGAGTATEAALAIKSRRSLVLLAPPEAAERFFSSLSQHIVTAKTPTEVVDFIREHLAKRGG